jgi:menaquinone-dependent protoporphyrinogen oxidase
MTQRTLIAYASKYGSTEEVAKYIAGILRDKGMEIDVKSVRKIKDISEYENIIIGSATRMDKLLKDALKFAENHTKELAIKKTAYFVVGATMKKDTAENREKVKGFLKPLGDIKEPISLGLFAGKIDYDKIGPVWRAIASKDETGLMEEGDFRDWEAIRAWALSFDM